MAGAAPPRRAAACWPAPAGPGRPAARAWNCWSSPGSPRHANALAETLSYGQRKLLELAYVLVADPDLVLLDEPAGGVNPSLIHHIAARIRDLNAGAPPS